MSKHTKLSLKITRVHKFTTLPTHFISFDWINYKGPNDPTHVATTTGHPCYHSVRLFSVSIYNSYVIGIRCTLEWTAEFGQTLWNLFSFIPYCTEIWVKLLLGFTSKLIISSWMCYFTAVLSLQYLLKLNKTLCFI